MSGFSFSATTRCDACGEYLDSSDENCDHPNGIVEQHIFRRITESEESPDTITIRATMLWKWYALAEELGEDWIAYEWLGPRESVQRMMGSASCDTIEDVPTRTMSIDAPNDVNEEIINA